MYNHLLTLSTQPSVLSDELVAGSTIILGLIDVLYVTLDATNAVSVEPTKVTVVSNATMAAILTIVESLIPYPIPYVPIKLAEVQC